LHKSLNPKTRIHRAASAPRRTV